jgi:hypothetical protein
VPAEIGKPRCYTGFVPEPAQPWPTFSVLGPVAAPAINGALPPKIPPYQLKPPQRTTVNVSVHNERRGIEPTVHPLQHRGFGLGQQASTLPCLDDLDHLVLRCL